ncbi:MAG TPA: isoleucine--tRNA ligase [Clostridia bacterium]|nr:isoleucine--tRNA ligase [Clostridia bacterium]
MDYSKTLNLPQTEFAMKANLPVKEPLIQEIWEKKGLYKTLMDRRKGRPVFILHDGPPYANGDIHMGTAFNKILKDIVVKFANMKGYCSPYVPGWDTHGLPIELQAIRALGIDRHAQSPVELRRRCKEFALKYVDIQRKQFKRLGVYGDWDHPYLTLDPRYEAKQVRVFGQMMERNHIYRGLKPVFWCTECETALAEAEIEYRDHRSPSIYVGFEVVEGKGVLPPGSRVIIWTTTPWTIPANMAIAVHPDHEYVLVTIQGPNPQSVVVAKDLLRESFSAMGLKRGRVKKTLRGKDLEGIVCRHPLYDRPSIVILGEHVSMEQGTGCVHTAPGHGEEDFEVCQKYGIKTLVPIDDHGVFTDEAGPFRGLFYEKANSQIVDALRQNGALWAEGSVVHQYPHCWRCKKPVIFRATTQWFASVDRFRKEALQAIEDVTWVPAWGKERIRNMVAERRDWCISRQRVWGVPLPILYCADCGEVLKAPEVTERIAEVFSVKGSDSWYCDPVEEFVPEGVHCARCGGNRFEKEKDIMDVWFDSGSSHAAVLEERPELRWPADLYLEGSDQHRGWFQSSLLTAVATRGRPPYKTVMTCGFVVDGEGRKMSKSLGNVVNPMDVMKRYGADILRLWAASADYSGDIRVSETILKQMAEVYRKIRNTFRFILGNLYDYDPEKDAVSYEDLLEVDRWVLMRLSEVTERVLKGYSSYQFHIVYHTVHNFCATDLSAFYLDILKDRLYCSAKDSRERRSAQTAMYIVLKDLVRLTAPILCHTAEEVWQAMPKSSGDPWSVHLSEMPEEEQKVWDGEFKERWKVILSSRDDVSKALEVVRGEKGLIGSSLEARVRIIAKNPEIGRVLKSCERDLASIYIVSQVEVVEPQSVSDRIGTDDEGEEPMFSYEGGTVTVHVLRPLGRKCARCWIFEKSVGANRYEDLCERCAEVVSASVR